MGATLEVLQTGRISYCLVAAVEGYPVLLTDHASVADIATAWTDTEWQSASNGLVVVGRIEQSIDPHASFATGSSLQLFVPGSVDDHFGKAVHSVAPPASYLAATIDANDLTIVGKNTSSIPASGEYYVGGECFAYSANNTGTATLTATTRGKYAPFGAGARTHLVGATAYSTRIDPTLSPSARTWIGRWVGVWMHAIVDGVACHRDDAQLLYAGKIADVVDDARTLGTVITLRPAAEAIANTMLLRDQYAGKVDSLVRIFTSVVCKAVDRRSSGGVVTTRTATDYTISAGSYTVDELVSGIASWLAGETVAARLWCAFRFEAGTVDGRRHTRLTREYDFTGVTDLMWSEVRLPYRIAEALGWPRTTATHAEIDATLTASEERVEQMSPRPLTRSTFGDGSSITVSDEIGSFFDQADYLPAVAAAVAGQDPAGAWGFFSVGGRVVFGRYAAGSIDYLKVMTGDGPVEILEGADPTITQVAYLVGRFDNLIAALFLSTGTPGYNHATHDALGYGLGAGVPAALLGDGFLDSLDRLTDAHTTDITITIEKPTKLREVIAADLLLRRAFLSWRGGTFAFRQWTTPTAAQAVTALTEANKAIAGDISSGHFSPTMTSAGWLYNVVKFRFNRLPNGDEYRDSVTIEDRSSLGELGEARPLTIDLRNTWAFSPVDPDYANEIDIRESLAAYLAFMPFFSRPVKLVRRTIAPTRYEGLSVGDAVTLTDSFARRSVDGQRGLAAKVAVVVRHSYDLGGPEPGAGLSSVRATGGEVDLALFEGDRVRVYAPSAQVDETASSGGFTDGYDGASTIRCHAHKVSDPVEAADASNFEVGDVIVIREIDPTTAASPDSWQRTVTGVSGNDISFSGGTLTGFSASKTYRVGFAGWAASTSDQKGEHAFQADDADGLIVDTEPYVYGASLPTQLQAAPAPGPFEKHATAQYGDGAPVSAGDVAAWMDNTAHLIDSRTAVCAPCLDTTERLSTATGSDWDVLFCAPFYFGKPNGPSPRTVSVAPAFRSSDGTSTTCRVTVSSRKPTTEQATNINVEFPPVSVSTEFTTSSTSLQHPTAVALSLNLGSVPYFWVTIEGKAKCISRGLWACSVDARSS